MILSGLVEAMGKPTSDDLKCTKVRWHMCGPNAHFLLLNIANQTRNSDGAAQLSYAPGSANNVRMPSSPSGPAAASHSLRKVNVKSARLAAMRCSRSSAKAASPSRSAESASLRRRPAPRAASNCGSKAASASFAAATAVSSLPASCARTGSNASARRARFHSAARGWLPYA